jgi:hypothetical protein
LKKVLDKNESIVYTNSVVNREVILECCNERNRVGYKFGTLRGPILLKKILQPQTRWPTQ